MFLHKYIKVAAVMFFAATIPVAAFAGTSSGKTVYVPHDQTIDGNYLAAGEQVIVEGTVNGDVIVAGGVVTVTGTVTGDVIAAGGQVRVLGPVQGDIRLVGGDVRVASIVGKNASVIGGNIEFTRDAAIGAGAMVLGGNVDMMGKIERELRVLVGAMRLGGTVGGDVWAKVGEADQFLVQPQAWIGGNLSYTAPAPAMVMSGATINGEVDFKTFERPQSHVNGGAVAGALLAGYLVFLLVVLVSLLLVGVVKIWLMPKWAEKVNKELSKNFWVSFGKGLVVTIIAPGLILLFILTGIGLPLALMAGAALFVLALSGMIYISTFFGEMILKKFTGRRWRGVSLYWSMALGVTLFVALTAIPVIGWIAKWFLLAAGLGAELSVTQSELKRYR